MRDREIRLALIERIQRLSLPTSNVKIVEEMVVCAGDARIDVAVVGGSSIDGFEIKSDQDSLYRLPDQQTFFSKVFDTVTILANPKHVDKIAQIVPGWWGVERVDGDVDGVLRFVEVRPSRFNPDMDGVSLAHLLWRDELISILLAKGIGEWTYNKSRRFLARTLAGGISLDSLRVCVRQQLLSRHWRSKPRLLVRRNGRCA